MSFRGGWDCRPGGSSGVGIIRALSPLRSLAQGINLPETQLGVLVTVGPGAQTTDHVDASSSLCLSVSTKDSAKEESDTTGGVVQRSKGRLRNL